MALALVLALALAGIWDPGIWGPGMWGGEQTVSFHAKTGTNDRKFAKREEILGGCGGGVGGVSKPLVFMQKQKPETGNSQKGKKSWGGPGPGPGQEGGEG